MRFKRGCNPPLPEEAKYSDKIWLEIEDALIGKRLIFNARSRFKSASGFEASGLTARVFQIQLWRAVTPYPEVLMASKVNVG